MVKATPQNFEFSFKVPERSTNRKKLELGKDVISDFKELLDKIPPLSNYGKLGAIFIQLPPNFNLEYFKTLEDFYTKYQENQKVEIQFTTILLLLLIK